MFGQMSISDLSSFFFNDTATTEIYTLSLLDALPIWLQTELALPVLMIAMVLVGAGFTMRHTRLGKTGIMVLAAVLVGFGFYFIRNFAQVLGESGQLPVTLAAWAPPFAGICLALGLLLHLEDG